MLNAFFITHGENGTLLYEKVFLPELNDNNLDLFNKFFTALKSFTSKIILDGSKEIKSVNLGDYKVKAAHVAHFNLDVILVVDNDDQKIIKRILPSILEIIKEYNEIFTEKEKKLELFKMFDERINNFIKSNKRFVNDVAINNKESVFKSIWNQKGAISTKLRNSLVKEKEKIIVRLQNEENLPNRLILFEKLSNILENLNDKENYNEIQEEIKKVTTEIRNRKVKLSYYLNLAKEALKYKEYNKAYSNFYSFTVKLKNMAKPKVQGKFRMLATILANKDKIPKIEFSQAVSEILISPDNIDEYLI
jgi:hypothetical protein